MLMVSSEMTGNSTMLKETSSTNLGVCDHQPAGGQNEGHKRSREKHLYDRDVTFLLFIDLAKRITVVYPVPSASTNG